MLNIKTSEDLFREILRIWQSIEPEYIQSFYKSVPRRIQNVIRLKGHLTKYCPPTVHAFCYGICMQMFSKFLEVTEGEF